MGRSDIVLGVDIGTTGCRACALSSARELVGAASEFYEPDRPRPGWAEQDPEVWWRAFRESVGRLNLPGGPQSVKALAVGAQSTALLPVDEGGRPLRKAIIWQDRRSADQCASLAEQFGEERIRSATGVRTDTFLVWPKVLWLQETEPEVFSRSRWFLQAGGYVVHRLCGEAVLGRADAVGYPLRLADLKWDEELCRWRDFPVQKIPEIVPSDAVVGTVGSAAAAECGLAAGTCVAAGGMDTACAALAVGVAAEGLVFEVAGTSGGIGVCSGTPSADRVLVVTPHLFEGLYINHAPMSAGGASLSWFVDQFCAEERQEAERLGLSAYVVLEQEVRALGDGPTGLLFLPYMSGERAPVWDARARGAVVGLSLDTTRRGDGEDGDGGGGLRAQAEHRGRRGGGLSHCGAA